MRVDGWVGEGTVVSEAYDPLLAKVMVVAEDRPAALARAARALDETEIGGLQTTLPFHRWLVREPAFRAGGISTEFVAHAWDGSVQREAATTVALLAALAADGSLAGLDGPAAAASEARPSRDDRVGRGGPSRGPRGLAAMTATDGQRSRRATLADAGTALERAPEAAGPELEAARSRVGDAASRSCSASRRPRRSGPRARSAARSWSAAGASR